MTRRITAETPQIDLQQATKLIFNACPKSLTAQQAQQVQSQAQIFVLCEQDDGTFSCTGLAYSGLIAPCMIAIASTGSSKTQQQVKTLHQALINELKRQGAQVVSPLPMLCAGMTLSADLCWVHSQKNWLKLLVLVGDDDPNATFPSTCSQWLTPGNYHIMPVYQGPPDQFHWRCMPSQVQQMNVAFWEVSITEVIPDILAIAQITTEDFRIFISYRRHEASAIADQLFAALSQQRFDVFLDRFVLPPGIDFAERLRQELADKSMVLVLESASILKSAWTQEEINTAKRHHMGLFAVQLPQGISVPGIPAGHRIVPDPQKDYNPDGTLVSDCLKRIVAQVRWYHGRALAERRSWLDINFRLAIALAQVLSKWPISLPVTSSDSLLHVQSSPGPKKPQRPKKYAVDLTPRPAALGDFEYTHTRKPSDEIGVLFSPMALIDQVNHRQLNWLAQTSQLKWQDEGLLYYYAQQMVAGAL